MQTDDTHKHPRPRKNARPAYTPSETWPLLAAFRARRVLSEAHHTRDKLAIADARKVLGSASGGRLQTEASPEAREINAGAKAYLAQRRAQRLERGQKGGA